MCYFPTRRFKKHQEVVAVWFLGSVLGSQGWASPPVTYSDSGSEPFRGTLVPGLQGLENPRPIFSEFLPCLLTIFFMEFLSANWIEWINEDWISEHFSERNKLDYVEVKAKVFLKCSQCFRRLKKRHSDNSVIEKITQVKRGKGSE